jgi:hypothetical protein
MNNILTGLFNNLQPTGEKPKWWQQFSYTEIFDFADSKLIDLAKNALFFQSLYQDGGPVLERQVIADVKDTEQLIKALQEFGFKIVYQTQQGDSGAIASVFGIHDTGAVYVKIYPNDSNWDELVCVSTDPKTVKEVCDLFFACE